MNKLFSIGTLGVLVCALGGVTFNACAATSRTADEHTPRLIVKYRGQAQSEQMQAQAQSVTTSREKAYAKQLNVTMHRVKVMASGATVYDLGKEMSLADARAAAARIAQDSSVEYAEPDRRTHAQSVTLPNDTYAPVQWPLMPTSSAAGGANFLGAWGFSQGSGVVVAVLDTGITSHPDLVGQTVAGYDFVSADSDGSFTTAGDGDGRDADPSDPGDYCAADGSTQSSWHGTKVTSQIVAIANNNYGIAGAAPSAKVMPLRVLGRCGGFMSDAADAVSWAAGVSVAGVPDNTSPVDVINMSMGITADGSGCSTTMQTAITAAINRGIPVIASAGNEGTASLDEPASCVGVISVAANTKSGDLASYSNYASTVTLAAAGGGACATQTSDCLNDATVSVGNSGTEAPGSPVEGNDFTGTSASAAQVSAAVALMRAVNKSLTPAQIQNILTSTAKAFAADSFCRTMATVGQCGAGMLDANAAVAAAQGLAISITPSYTTTTITGGQQVSLAAAVTGNMGSSYQWTQVGGPTVTLTGSNTATVSFTTPATRSAVVLSVSATTSTGSTVIGQYTVSVDNPPTLPVTTYSLIAGQTLNVQLAGVDADGDTLTYSLQNGPSGMTVTEAGVLVYATPTVGAVNATIVLTASGGDVTNVPITVNVTATGTSSSGSGGGGGGGSMDFGLLTLLAVAAVVTGKRRQR